MSKAASRRTGAGDLDAPASEEAHPADHDARRRIDTTFDRTIFANAGAGSGKTAHLVERVCGLVVRGRARIDELAVITFTEAAAAELRDRVAESLEQVAKTSSDASGAQRAADGLAALDGAAITTLHGFARRILAAHPFEAGLPATFEVLDEARSLADLDEQWHGVVLALLDDDGTARAVQWLIVSGANVSTLRPIFRKLGENWDRVESRGARAVTPPLPQLDVSGVLDPLVGALELASHCTDADDRLLGHLESLGPVARALRDVVAGGAVSGPSHGGAVELGLLEALSASPASYGAGNRGRADAWGGRKPEVQSLLGEAQQAREHLVATAVDAALTTIVAALGRSTLDAARRRRHDGRLQYHDLLVLACALVRSHRDVRASLHEEFSAILVDEFQDTDPLQAELVCMIAAAPTAEVGDVAWWELPVVPGALFFVGDPLQSIYGFRRADIATFMRVRAAVAQETASLVTNFRSVPGIVEFVNAVFGALVGPGVDALQPPHERAVPARPAARINGALGVAEPVGGVSTPACPAPACPVTVLGAGVEETANVEEARTREARELATLLARAVDEGWPIGRDGRPVQPDDIAVLVPSRRSVPAIEAAFDAAELPYRLESSSLVYSASEVADLLHVLRAIDDPSDASAVVAALRTPGFGCGDDDLVRFRLAGGTWDYQRLERSEGARGDPVRRALERLQVLRDVRVRMGVSELVARVVEECRQLGAALDDRRWREEWRRLRFVVDQARQFAESSPGGLREYLAWVEVQRGDDARVTEIVLPESDAPAVAVMTVHAAKGLEFPVVGVVGLGSAPRGVRCPTVLFGPDGVEVGVRSTRATAGFADARAREDLVQAHERLRLLYVAVTRAQNHLVVSVHRGTGASTSTAARLSAVLDTALGLWSAHDGAVALDRDSGASTRDGPASPVETRDGAEELDRWAREREAALAPRRRVVAATSVASLAIEVTDDPTSSGAPRFGFDSRRAGGPEDQATTPDVEGDDGATPDEDVEESAALWRRGRAGTAVGRAVHAVLQTADLATGDGVDAMAMAHAAREGAPERAGEVAALARVALDSDIVRLAVSGRYWREIYVGMPVGARVLEGFVDLVYERPDGLAVVDYKTDRLEGDAPVGDLVQRYRLQGAAYAFALRAVTGREVVECTFLFLRAERAIAGSVPDLPDAIEEVLSLLGGEPAPRGLSGQ